MVSPSRTVAETGLRASRSRERHESFGMSTWIRRIGALGAKMSAPGSFVAALAATDVHANNKEAHSLISSERDTDNFLIIAGIDRFVCKSWMRPNHQTTGIAINRIDQVSAADFLVIFRS